MAQVHCVGDHERREARHLREAWDELEELRRYISDRKVCQRRKSALQRVLIENDFTVQVQLLQIYASCEDAEEVPSRNAKAVHMEAG